MPIANCRLPIEKQLPVRSRP